VSIAHRHRQLLPPTVYVPDPHSSAVALAWHRGTDLDQMPRATIERERAKVNAAIDAAFPHVPAVLIRRAFLVSQQAERTARTVQEGV